MKITRKTLDKAVEENILSQEQSQQLTAFLKAQMSNKPRFDLTHVLYYFGGMIAIGAMSIFMNLGWELWGGAGIFFIAVLYAGIGLTLVNMFARKSYEIPAGICATFVVALTPLAVYGLQQAMGVWPDDIVYRDYHRYIQWHWLYMELATLAVGAILAWKYKYPFLVMPIAVTCWYLSMDLSAMLTGGDLDWALRALVSMYMGLLMIVLAFWVDVRTRYQADYAFWLYLFGVMAFWLGMSLQYSDSELSKFIYFTINFFMIIVGVILTRRVFAVFGSIGCFIYISHLAFELFKESWLFPITLSAIGLMVIYLGIFWQKNEEMMSNKLRSFLPIALQELIGSK